MRRPMRLPRVAHLDRARPVGRRIVLGLLGLSAMSSACTIRAAGSVAQPTALERQMTGAYRELDPDLVMLASFRDDAGVTPAWTTAEKQLFRHRVQQKFNADDLAMLKDAGCVVEGADARLKARACPALSSPATALLRQRVLQEENEAREALIAFAAERRAAEAGRVRAEARDRREVRRAYRALLFAAGTSGQWFESDTGAIEARP